MKTSHKQNKHTVIGIQKESPADLAGLIEGDRILEVNGESVEGVDRDEIVSKIVKHSNFVELCVLNEPKINDDEKKPDDSIPKMNSNNNKRFLKNARTLPNVAKKYNRANTVSSYHNLGLTIFGLI